jgi:hypothetical protein
VKEHVVVQRFALDCLAGFGVGPGLLAGREADEVCDCVGNPFGVQFDIDIAETGVQRCRREAVCRLVAAGLVRGLVCGLFVCLCVGVAVAGSVADTVRFVVGFLAVVAVPTAETAGKSDSRARPECGE